MDFNVPALLGAYGPSITIWIILLGALAGLLGKGGKMMLTNVQGLLKTSEGLREQMGAALVTIEAQLKNRDAIIAELRVDYESCQKVMRKQGRDVGDLEDQVYELTRELERCKGREQARKDRGDSG